jgi:hypothetical protein
VKAKHACWGSLLVFCVAQSCSNDFDKFDVGAASGMSSGGKLSIAGASAGTVSTAGRRPGVGGTTAGGGAGAGESFGGAPLAPEAGAAGTGVLAGAGGAEPEPEPPCGGLCELEHATALCVEDACVIDECSEPWGDCNQTASDGCEHALASDLANCGECERACSTVNVAAVECAASVCSSSCAPGFANCSQAETPDDGCETPVSADAANCGGCGNQCPAGFVCQGGRCGCDFKNDCGNGSGVECVSNLCQCDLTACRPGERCRDASGDKVCSCNGAAACLDNELCCEAGGCTDVLSDAANCGACGRVCSTGFACVAGACECDSVVDCGGVADAAGAGGAGGASEGSAGGAGAPTAPIACVGGSCVCDGAACPVGQRCMADGSCG